MIITPPSFWHGRDYLKWLTAILLAFLGHWGFVLAFGDKNHPAPEPLSMPAVMLEFAEFAQSATKVEQLTIGLPQEVTQDSVASPSEPSPPVEPVETPKVAVEESPAVEEPEIVVEKQQNETPDPQTKPKTEPKVQPNVKSKVEPKKVAKKPVNKTSPKKVNAEPTERDSNSEVNSQASSQVNSAPPKGDDSQTAAPNDSDAHSKQLTQHWQSKVLGKLRRHQSYPHSALENRIEGTVAVNIQIDAQGNVLSAIVRKSSGHNVLDSEAIKIVQRASPLPAPPENLVKQGKVAFSVPIRFNIKEYRKWQNLG